MMMVTAADLAKKRIKAGDHYVWRKRKWEGQRLIAGWHCGAERSGVAGTGWAGVAPAKEADRRAGGRAGMEPRTPSNTGRRMAGRTRRDGDGTQIGSSTVMCSRRLEIARRMGPGHHGTWPRE
jgi:hypothetical protein